MMRDAICSFPEQLTWVPVIENKKNFSPGAPLVVCGMGGSHLAADIFEMLRPGSVVGIHSDYGVPQGAEKNNSATFLMSSYSGNTEETLSAYDAARAAGLSVAVMTVGGKLLNMAHRDGVPFIQFPNTGIQPRASVGFGVRACAAFVGDSALSAELELCAAHIHPAALEAAGRALGETLEGTLPVVYASMRNAALAQNWKIKINENAKAPAFWNTLPEMNHNEMTGFDSAGGAAGVTSLCHAVFLCDTDDHPRVRLRMDVMEKLFHARAIGVVRVPLTGATRAEKIFNSLLLGDWTSVALGERYGVDTEKVPLVEEFKSLLT